MYPQSFPSVTVDEDGMMVFWDYDPTLPESIITNNDYQHMASMMAIVEILDAMYGGSYV